MVAIAVAQALGVVLGGLFLVSLGAGLCFAPALTLLSEVAEASGLHQGFAAGLSNMAWASGQVVGGPGRRRSRQRRRLRGAESRRRPHVLAGTAIYAARALGRRIRSRR